MSVNLKNNPIWYQFENRTANRVMKLSGGELIDFCEEIKTKSELSETADSLILKVKHTNEAEYSTTLDPDYFQNHCNNDFKKLVNTFNISRINPVKVIRPGMSLFPFCLLLIFLCHCRIETQQIHSFIHLLSF